MSKDKLIGVIILLLAIVIGVVYTLMGPVDYWLKKTAQDIAATMGPIVSLYDITIQLGSCNYLAIVACCHPCLYHCRMDRRFYDY